MANLTTALSPTPANGAINTAYPCLPYNAELRRKLNTLRQTKAQNQQLLSDAQQQITFHSPGIRRTTEIKQNEPVVASPQQRTFNSPGIRRTTEIKQNEPVVASPQQRTFHSPGIRITAEEQKQPATPQQQANNVQLGKKESSSDNTWCCII